MGMTKMSAYDFSSWSLHMALIIICGNFLGLGFKEWRGASLRTFATVWTGIFLPNLGTGIIGWGNALAQSPAP